MGFTEIRVGYGGRGRWNRGMSHGSGGEVSREGVRRAVLFALARLGGGGWKLES